MLSKEQIEVLKNLSTGNIADANGKGGNMDCGIKPLSPAFRLCGPAYTCKTHPGDNLALHRAMYEAKEGDILIIDANGYSAGHLGDIMALAAKVRGLGGIIIDGGCRDSQDIIEIGFPVFSRSLNPGGTVKETVGKTNIPIVCGGICVNPSDIVCGDADGVVVIKKEDASAVYERAAQLAKKEENIRKMLQAGKTTLEIYGFDKLLEEKSGK